MRFYISLLLLCKTLFAVEMHDIEGIWEIPEETEGKVSIAEIFIENNKAYAYTFMYANEKNNKLTIRNIDDENGNVRKLKNMIFLSGLEFNGDEWDNGRIYNPNDGELYNVSASLSSDKNILKIRVSFDRFGLLGRTLEWKRLNKNDFLPPNHNKIGIVSALRDE